MAERVRVLPKAASGVRPGQVWQDERGRVLWVQNVVDEVRGALCFVLSATGRKHRGAFVKLARLEQRGELVKDRAVAICMNERCGGTGRRKTATMLDPKDDAPFCSTECWRAVGRDARAVRHG